MIKNEGFFSGKIRCKERIADLKFCHYWSKLGQSLVISDQGIGLKRGNGTVEAT